LQLKRAAHAPSMRMHSSVADRIAPHFCMFAAEMGGAARSAAL
jgi:hypothetical protein